MAKKRRHLGEILYKAGLVKKEPLINAIKTSKTKNKRLGQVLLELGLLDEETLTKAIAKQFELEYVNLDRITIPPEATKLVSEDLIRKHNVLPLGMDNGRLRLIISDPLNLDTMDAIRFRLNTELDCCLASPSKISSYIQESLDKRKLSVSRLQAVKMTALSSGW
jgi:type IV pilus assembly protein PilB